MESGRYEQPTSPEYEKGAELAIKMFNKEDDSAFRDIKNYASQEGTERGNKLVEAAYIKLGEILDEAEVKSKEALKRLGLSEEEKTDEEWLKIAEDIKEAQNRITLFKVE